MGFEAMTCPRCGANLPYAELTSGRQIVQCQVCRACMENPRFGEFMEPAPAVLQFNGDSGMFKEELRRRREERRRTTVRKVPEVVGYRRTVWPYLTALFASASVMFASTLILVGMGLVDVDFGALFGMIGMDGVDENMGIMYTVALTAGSMVTMMACNSMPSKIPVFEMVEKEVEE